MPRTIHFPSTFLAPFLTLLLFSCEYEKKEAQLNALATEVRFLQKDSSEAKNAIAASKREEESLLMQYYKDYPSDQKNSPLKEQLETARHELITTKATYEKLTLEIQSYKEKYSLDDVSAN